MVVTDGLVDEHVHSLLEVCRAIHLDFSIHDAFVMLARTDVVSYAIPGLQAHAARGDGFYEMQLMRIQWYLHDHGYMVVLGACQCPYHLGLWVIRLEKQEIACFGTCDEIFFANSRPFWPFEIVFRLVGWHDVGVIAIVVVEITNR